MAIKREKVGFLGSLLEQTRVSINKDNMQPGDLAALFTIGLTAASPKPRYDNLKELADQINEYLKNIETMGKDEKKLCKEELNEVHELLDKASKMLDAGGSVGPINDIRVFNAILKDVEAKIEILSHEIYAYPMARVGNKLITGCSKGGKKRCGGEEKRIERNILIQKEINRLCLVEKHSYRNACRILSEKPELYSIDGQTQNTLHPDTIKKITKNPYSL